VFCFLICSLFLFSREFHRGDPGEETEISACHIPLFRCFYSPPPPHAFGFLSYASSLFRLLCPCSCLTGSFSKEEDANCCCCCSCTFLPPLPPSLPPSLHRYYQMTNHFSFFSSLLSFHSQTHTLSLPPSGSLASQPICTHYSASIPPLPPSLTHTYLNNPPSLPPFLPLSLPPSLVLPQLKT